MFGINPYLFFLLLGLIGWALMSSAPGAYAYRKAQRESRTSRKAEAATRTASQAHRRPLFGSHPVLYWGLAWLSAPVLLCLIAALMER